MILVYDCETSGFPIWKAPSADPGQPHLVQLAFLLFDQEGVEVEAFSAIIRPDGWKIDPEAAAVHGITDEIAAEKGIPEMEAVAQFLAAWRRAAMRVAHNITFDDRIMRIALLRHGLTRAEIEDLEKGAWFCTLERATHVVNLPPTEKMVRAGFTKPKPPKLSECMKHFFGEELDGAHDALVDVRACAKVYFHLRQRSEAA